MPPTAAVTTPIKAETNMLSPISRAIRVPFADQAPSPIASGYFTVFEVSSITRDRAMIGPNRAIKIGSQSQYSFSTQKKGRRSSKRSLTVPPPKAVKKAKRPTPNRSTPRRIPSIIQDAANAQMPMTSSTVKVFVRRGFTPESL